MKPSIFNAYRALFLRHQANGLNMARVDGIDVCGLFFIASVRGNMSMGFSVIFEKPSYEETCQLTITPTTECAIGVN